MTDATNELERQAEALLTEEKWQEGLALADRAAAENPTSEFAQRLRFIGLSNLDRNADAIVAARRAAELAPSNANPQYLLATALFAAEDDSGALAAIDRAIELEDDVPLYWKFRVRVLMHHDQSRVEEAVRAIKERMPLTADLINLLGCFAEQRSFREARELYSRALELDPNCKDAKYNYSRVWWGSLPRAFKLGAIAAAVLVPILAGLALVKQAAWFAPVLAFTGVFALMTLIRRANGLARSAPAWTIEK